MPLGKFQVSIDRDFEVRGLWGYLWVSYDNGDVEIIKVNNLNSLWWGPQSLIIEGHGHDTTPVLADAWGLIGNYILQRDSVNMQHANLYQVWAPREQISSTNFIDSILGFIG